MKSTTADRIAEYRFQDRRNHIWLLPITSLLVGGLMLFVDPLAMIADGNVIYSLAAAGGISALMITYDWRNIEVNRLILIAYLLAVALELYFAGIPEGVSSLNSGKIGKGVMLEIFLYTLPYTYVLLKIGIALPLVLICKR